MRPHHRLISRIAQVRSEYTSARLICSNLEHRIAGTRFERARGYLPAEIDYVAADGTSGTLHVRDYDVRYLDRVAVDKATEHLESILRARRGDPETRQELERRTRETWKRISARFAGTSLIETEEVIPYTTTRSFPEAQTSNKGSILLDLSGYGFATADFCLLTASAHLLPPERLEKCLRDTIRNLEILSGRKLEDPENPLLIAMRSALPEYLPGFMPTYLNVGLTPEMLPGLPRRYGEEAAVRIRLSNRKTLLEALDPESFRDIEKEILPARTMKENIELISSIEALIEKVRGEMAKEKPPVKAEKRKLTNIQKIKLIQETLGREIVPALKADGGDLDLIDIEGNKVFVALRGSCSFCPSAEVTLKQYVETKLKEFVSDDIVVEEVRP